MLIKLRKAQSTAEYAILFAVVIAAAMGVQSYVKKALQARIYTACNDFIDATGGGTIYQWEGTDSTKNTYNQTSSREFTEDYENQDTPFSYTEKMDATYDSLTTQ